MGHIWNEGVARNPLIPFVSEFYENLQSMLFLEQSPHVGATDSQCHPESVILPWQLQLIVHTRKESTFAQILQKFVDWSFLIVTLVQIMAKFYSGGHGVTVLFFHSNSIIRYSGTSCLHDRKPLHINLQKSLDSKPPGINHVSHLV